MPMIDEAVEARVLPAGGWSIDAARSRVEFSLRHMVFKTVHGRFHEFDGILELGANGGRATGTVKAASIDTGDPVRDEHLRCSCDFFDVERHPDISFASRRIELLDGGRVRVEGELRMRGATHAISLEGHLGQRAAGAHDGGETITLTLQGEVSRSDFGLVWNQKLDTGGALLGDSVAIALEITAVTRATESPRS